MTLCMLSGRKETMFYFIFLKSVVLQYLYTLYWQVNVSAYVYWCGICESLVCSITESWYWTIFQESCTIVEWRAGEGGARIAKMKGDILEGNRKHLLNNKC